MLCRVLVLKRGQLVQIVDTHPIEHQPGERGGKMEVGSERKSERGRRKGKGVRRERSMREVRR